MESRKKFKKILPKIIHWVIILNFLFEIGYSGVYQTFFVLVPNPGQFGPLFGASTEIPFELMVTRRLYAIETWIAITGLAIYLALVYRKQLAGLVKELSGE